mmetsp:Transcript_16038/g.48547  ORF Transcript_16038/g.48547 Transcript_16038/m.48547 type:complete len:659 (-) Transcript_16038:630-2606(-)
MSVAADAEAEGQGRKDRGREEVVAAVGLEEEDGDEARVGEAEAGGVEEVVGRRGRERRREDVGLVDEVRGRPQLVRVLQDRAGQRSGPGRRRRRRQEDGRSRRPRVVHHLQQVVGRDDVRRSGRRAQPADDDGPPCWSGQPRRRRPSRAVDRRRRIRHARRRRRRRRRRADAAVASVEGADVGDSDVVGGVAGPVAVPDGLEAAFEVADPAQRVPERGEGRRAARGAELGPDLPVAVGLRGQRDGEVLVGRVRVDDEFGSAGGAQQRRGHARRHLVAEGRDHRAAAPQDVAARGVGVALRRVQEQVGEGAAFDVLVLRRHGREVELRRVVDAALPRFRADVGFARGREAQQPQNRAGDAPQDAAPHVEDAGVDLVDLVEVGEHKGRVLADAVLRPRRQGRLVEHVGRALGVVVDEVRVGHAHDLLGEVALVLFRRDDAVRHDVLHVLGAQRPAEPHVAHLDRRRLQREDLVPRALRVAVQIHQDVDLVASHRKSGVPRGEVRHVHERLDLVLDLAPPLRPVVRRQRIAHHVVEAPVVHPKDRLHQVRQRVVAEVGRHVADPHARRLVPHHRRLREQLDRLLRRHLLEQRHRQLQHLRVEKSAVRVPHGDALDVLHRNRVHQRVERLHRRHAPALLLQRVRPRQLLLLVLLLLHARLVF